MPINKSHFINVRIRPQDKLYLISIASKKDVRLSDFVREVLYERIIKEKLNKKPN
jgi:hypothetical protein